MNRKIRIQEESVSDRNTQGRTINHFDLSAALVKKEAFQRFIFLISTDIGSFFSVTALIRCDVMIIVFKIRMHQLVQVLTRYHHRCKKQDERIILIAVLIDKHGISFTLAFANHLGK